VKRHNTAALSALEKFVENPDVAMADLIMLGYHIVRPDPKVVRFPRAPTVQLTAAIVGSPVLRIWRALGFVEENFFLQAHRAIVA
jgi:hypothetical protein